MLVVRAGDTQIHALAPVGSGFNTGSNLRLRLDPESIHLFDPATERSLLWN